MARLLQVLVFIGVASVALARVISTDAEVDATISFKSSSQDSIRRLAGPIKSGNTITTVATSIQRTGNSASADSLYIISGAAGEWPFINWARASASATSNGGTFSADASLIATSLKFLAVVQFLDKNGNNVFDDGEQTKVTKLLSLNLNTNVTASQSTPGVSIVSTTTVDGQFGFRYTVQPKPITNQGVSVDEGTLKIDVWTVPVYASNADPKTRIAIVATLSAQQATASFGGSVSSKDENKTISASGGVKFSTPSGASAGLSWASDAVVQTGSSSNSVKVVSSIISLNDDAAVFAGANFASARYAGGVSKLLVFNFATDKPSEIYWDPSYGQSGDASVLTISCLVLVVIAFLF